METQTTEQTTTKTGTLFKSLVDSLEISKYLYENDMSPPKEKALIDAILEQNVNQQLSIIRGSTTEGCAALAYAEFIKEFGRRSKRPPEKLAVEMTGSKLLIWAEIKEGDEDLLDALLLADARTTTTMQEHSYATSIIVVDSEDHIDVPNHYQVVYPQKVA